MWTRALVLAVFLIPTLSRGQGIPTGVVGWYNGDWKQFIASSSNWQSLDGSFSRIYDDVAVPDGGWTVVGVFAHVDMAPAEITQAVWEIRSGVSAGNGGMVVASGVGAATMTHTASVGGGHEIYLLQVSGLWIQLPAGRYWVSLAPITSDPQTYLCATLGTNAIGEPKGTDGAAYRWGFGSNFAVAQTSGQGGTTGDYSLGLLISGATATRETAWRSDFDSLVAQMTGLHSLPFPGVAVDQFQTQAADLAARATALSDAEMRTQLQALVASIGDPHTDVIWPSPRPFRSLPLSAYWFDDGVYIIGAASQYGQLLGKRITGIGSATIDEAIAKLTALVAHDNDSWLRYVLAGSRLMNADFLYGTGVAPAPGSGIEVQVEAAPGSRQTTVVETLDQGTFSYLVPVYQGALPLYRQHPEKPYWATALEGGEVVYFQYNSCMEDVATPSAWFFQQLDQLMAAPNARKLIVDLRNNTGGTTGILNPWFERLKSSRFNQRGRLYVIVGRATFSAAMEHSNRFREETAAIFVGEPTGGKPRFLLRKGDFGLPYFGIRVSYSQGVEKAADPGDTLIPDIRTPVTFRNYMAGVDPALDAILPIARTHPGRPR
jgi:hypothetical protein